jgi:hypothetical protein
MDDAAVERSFGELLAAFGDLVVARTRGAPADPSRGSTRTLVRRYRARRRAFDAALGGLAAGSSAGDDARALANMRASLEWLDEAEPMPRVRPAGVGGARGGGAGGGGAGGGSAASSVDAGQADGDDPAVVRARAALYRRYGEAAGAVRFGSVTLDRPTVLARLATEPDAIVRRTLFEALAPVWRTVDGDGNDASPYRWLLRASAERWRVHGSPIEANAVALGLPPGSIEGSLQAILAAWRTVMGPGRLEPWDYRYVVGAAARRLDRLVPADRLLDLDHRYVASLGADPDRLGIVYDVLPRPGRPLIPVAFTIGMGAWAADQPLTGPWTPRPPWVFATYAEGGIGNLAELLHESGHAIHMAAVRARPAFLDWAAEDTAFLEGTADVLGWDADEPAWQRHWLGEAAEPREALLSRYGAVMLDLCWALFEIELHRHPERRPNDVWTEVTTDGLGIAPHPEWSWWAIRGQLIDGPGYLANYALSAIMAAAVRARVLSTRGPWFAGDPGWYRSLSDALFSAGASQTPADLLGAFLGGPLTAGPLLADMRRAG